MLGAGQLKGSGAEPLPPLNKEGIPVGTAMLGSRGQIIGRCVMPPFGFWVQGRTIQSVTASLPLGCIRHLIPGSVPGLHPAPFVALPKKPWKEEGRS